MTALSLPFPGGRALAGWWRQLAPFRPEAIWIGHLFLHRVEALCRLRRAQRPDPFALLVLRALSLGPPGSANSHGQEQLRWLDDRLHLGRQALLQVVRGLVHEGLAHSDAPGHWIVAEPGQQALAQGEVVHESWERQTYYFAEPGPDGGDRPPVFLPLCPSVAEPWTPADPWRFDAAVLRDCVARPAEWKRQWHFPPEVDAVVSPGDADPAPADAWQRVLVDHPEHLAVAVIRSAAEADRPFLGFAVKQEGWVLPTGQPVFAVGGALAEALPELRPLTDPEAWRPAWRQWCRQRSFPPAEADAAELEPAGAVLRVRLPGRLLERLRAARSDALKGEAWLLAGDGSLRAAARLEVHEPASQPQPT
jgi:hypothetical protein